MKRHPIPAYFFLVYLITWGLIILLVGPERLSGVAVPAEKILLTFFAMILGASSTGLLMTALFGGKAGLRDLLDRQRRWRVEGRWYLVATLTVPVLILSILLVLTAFVSTGYIPRLAAAGFLVGPLAGFFEEIGWTGFALPKLQQRFSPLASSLILGFLWGVWHFMANLYSIIPGQELAMLPGFLVFVLSVTAYRVLIAWMYNHTRSLLLAQIMHACYSGPLFLFTFLLPAAQVQVFNLVFMVVLWMVLAAVFAARREELTLQQTTN